MKKERIVWIFIVLGILTFYTQGQQITTSAQPDTSNMIPVVVAMNSHEISSSPGWIFHHFFRVWSDGYTDWNCRAIQIDDGVVFWGGWESIDEDTGPYCQ